MHPDFKSLFILYTSITVACVLFRIAYKEKDTFQWAKPWFIFVAVGAITTNIWLLYFSVIIVCLNSAPKKLDEKVFYYLVIFVAMPDLQFKLPFPGINYLFILEYPRLLALVVLLPIYFELRKRKQDIETIPLDKFVLAYCIVSTLLDFRLDTSITFWARSAFMTFLDIWLPYYVISNVKADHRRWILAILFSALILAVEGVIEWRLIWKSYAKFARHIDDVNINKIWIRNYFRGLGLRISTSWFEPITFGTFIATMIYAAFNIKRLGKQQNFFGYMVMGVMTLALLFTDSRGAILTCLIALAAGFYFHFPSKGWKSFYKFGVVVGVVVVYLAMETLSGMDEEGTFDYRAQLVVNSVDAISRNPLLGTPFYRSNEVLVETMMQGQGIVDFVNTYLKTLLQYGAVGLFLFLGMFLYAIFKMFSRVSALEKVGDERYHVGTILIGMICGLAVVIATVSPVAYLMDYVWFTLAMISGYIKQTADLGVKKPVADTAVAAAAQAPPGVATTHRLGAGPH
ncbi:O-antigen ligase family protein [Marinibactrum halimedae]|uniref:O-antigen ligase-related domain-containing protein n=1 Tax=Marinibactrum halimedae TaxID=1444977 RepID=A0AA37WMT6_9GAMM|nr:O-antigen ligase family protein [Marinibactrum halimedae]MCD9459756.1 O-antigen ligase family protein [Marinibactrum halimedae]GLS24487.1 hypothetical protein GCM10007877_01990 [Marinibactrum halimedae]